jgi:Ku protein
MSAPMFADSMPVPTSAASSPRGRASWSGVMTLSFVAIPIKAYPAANSSQQVHFNQLHAGCGQRIRYQKHCPVHGKVEAGAIVAGYAYAPDHYVVVDQDELEQLRPPQERALCLEGFLEAHAVDPALFSGRTLYLLPDGLAAQHAYGRWVGGAMPAAGLVAGAGAVVPSELPGLDASRPLTRYEFPRHADGDMIAGD